MRQLSDQILMESTSLRDALFQHLPHLDEILDAQKVPVHERIFRAAFLFVEISVIATNPEKEDLLKIEPFREVIVPIVSDWYWGKYGELCRDQRHKELLGIVVGFAQPLALRIPQTLSRVEVEGELARLSFPDALQSDENIEEMFPRSVDFELLADAKAIPLKAEAAEIVHLTRSINLNLMSNEGMDEETFALTQTIWPHFENAIRGILTLSPDGATAGCWDLHLAVEKSYKALIRARNSGYAPFGHDLKKLHKAAESAGAALDEGLMKKLPSDKEAIQYRYVEALISVDVAAAHYRTALELVDQITSCLPRKLRLNNASILIRRAPWAK